MALDRLLWGVPAARWGCPHRHHRGDARRSEPSPSSSPRSVRGDPAASGLPHNPVSHHCALRSAGAMLGAGTRGILMSPSAW